MMLHYLVGSLSGGRKVFISPSNQLDNILTGINKSEHEVAMGITNKLKSILESKGYNVGTDSDPNMNGKIGKNPTSGKNFLQNKDDGIYIAIHTNAGGASGPETFYNENEALAKNLAQKVNDGLFNLYSTTYNGSNKTSKNRGIKQGISSGINEIKYTKDFYSILTEISFGDNAQEAKYILDNTDKIAETLAKAIDDFFNENLPNAGSSDSVGIPSNIAKEQWIYPLTTKHTADPLTGGRYFGALREINKRDHAAIDLIVPPGTKVIAMTDGVVGDSYGYYKGTNAVEVVNSDGTIARYCEMSVSVKFGQIVKKGDVLGKIIANTDGSSMLHIELYDGSGVGPLTNKTNRIYKNLSGELAQKLYQRRSDLMNPTFVKDLPMANSQ